MTLSVDHVPDQDRQPSTNSRASSSKSARRCWSTRAQSALGRSGSKALVADIAALHGRGADVLVVSSGAIALGRTIAGLPKGALKLEDSQAAAAIGQIALARAWAEALHAHGIVAGQVLLTLNDTEERRRYLNARETLGAARRHARHPRHQRERHGRDQRNPLRRQRPARRARRHHGERRSADPALRHRRPLHRAAEGRPDGAA